MANVQPGFLPRGGRIAAVLVHGLVALVLLFAQREAALHWLSHATDAAAVRHALVASSDTCDECLSLSALGNMICPEPLLVPALHVPTSIEPASTWISAVSLLRLGYASRGPPTNG